MVDKWYGLDKCDEVEWVTRSYPLSGFGLKPLAGFVPQMLQVRDEHFLASRKEKIVRNAKRPRSKPVP